METLIKTLGWIFLVLIIISAITLIIEAVKNHKENKLDRRKKNLHDEIVIRLRSASDWLGSPLYRPFQSLIDVIINYIKTNVLSLSNGQGLRDEIHKIIETEMDIQRYIDINKNKGELSDGYHSFNELYHFRMLYNAALFNEWAKQSETYSKYDVHKSKKHHDGELCFGGGWFIVVAVLPTGQISNHYEEKYWDLFQIPETEKAMFEFDGHTSGDVADRLEQLLTVK